MANSPETTASPARFNLAQALLDERIDEGQGARVALITPQRRISYAEVQAEANRAANALAEAGVGPEERVLLALPDVPELVYAFFGALKLGAIPIIVNPEMSEDDNEYVLRYTRARALVTTAATARRIGALLRSTPLLRLVLTLEEDDAGFATWRQHVACRSTSFRNAETGPDDPALWLFSSGSTGRPLAAVHLQHDYMFSVQTYARGVLGMEQNDVVLSVPRLFFNYATGMSLIFPFAMGAAAVLFPERPTPGRIAQLAASCGATMLATVPTMVAKMLASPEVSRAQLTSVRVAVSAGEALPAELHRRWTEATGVELLDGIGSVEACHIFISNRRGDARPGTIGFVVPGYEARVVRPDGSEAAPDESGVLWIKGDSAAIHYHAAHERSKRVLRGDWIVTGDLVRRDAEGRFVYEGRADDMLKVSGIYVSPYEVENVLLMHPAVRECAVAAFDDADRLTRLKAYLVLTPSAREAAELALEQVQTFARERLASHKVPRRWELLEELPRSDRDKLLRRKLK